MMSWCYCATVIIVCACLHCGLGAESSNPFVIITSPEKDLENFQTFSSDVSSNYRTLTLDDDTDTLYIGAKDRVFGQTLANIKQQSFPVVEWPVSKIGSCEMLPQSQGGKKCYNLIQMVQPLNSTHILICGTNSLTPKNKFLVKSSESNRYSLVTDNVIRSPLCSFDPEDSISSLVTDDSIFSTPRSDLQSKISIVKTMSNGLLMSNENMQEEHIDIVASFTEVDDATSPEMLKVYFVSDENANEPHEPYAPYAATITQVCANDMGGKNILTNEWTSLLKVRLLCRTVDKYPLVFDLITHAVLGNDRTLYATFTTRHDTARTNAVCAFRLNDIQEALNKGDYWEEEQTSRSYKSVAAPDNSLRPGICAYPGMLKNKPEASTSKDFPESHLAFMREHNLVTSVVTPAYPASDDGPTKPYKAPLVIKSGDKFTKIAIDPVTDLDGRTHDVIFVATKEGKIYKFVAIVKEESVESIELAQYEVSRSPIVSMKLSHRHGKVYVGTDDAVHQVSTSNCAAYNKTCDFCDPCRMCILSRDPNCAWDKLEKKCVSTRDRPSTNLLQDVSEGDAVTQCKALASSAFKSTEKRVDDGATEILGYIVKNPGIVYSWYRVKDNNVKEKIKENDKYRITKDGQLVISDFNAENDAATYECEYSAVSTPVAKADYIVRSSKYVPLETPAVTVTTVSPGVMTDSSQENASTVSTNTTGVIGRSNGPFTTTDTASISQGSSAMIAAISIAVVIFFIFGGVLFWRFKARTRDASDGKRAEEVENGNQAPPLNRDNSTNNNNAGVMAVQRLPSAAAREEQPLLPPQEPRERDLNFEEGEKKPEEKIQRGAKSLEFLDARLEYIDDEEDGPSQAGRNVTLETSSSLREEAGRTRVPPSRTKSMPGSALYVVYAGKKLQCSTLQRNKKGNWVIEVPNQSGMSDMGATNSEDDVIDIVHDDTTADDSRQDATATIEINRDSPPSRSEKQSESENPRIAQNKMNRKAFFESDTAIGVGDRTPTINYVTSTPHQYKPSVPPMFDSKKKPLKGQTSQASLRSLGHNSSEEPDSDSTVKGSSSTLRQEDTPSLKHPHHHHRTRQGAVSKVPTSVPTSDIYVSSPSQTIKASVSATTKRSYKSHSNRSLDASSGSSDGDEQLHGRDKNMSRKSRIKPPDSPSKESHSSSSSASSSDYRSARSSVISDQNHDQR